MVKIVRLMKAAPAPRLNRVSTWSFVPKTNCPKRGNRHLESNARLPGTITFDYFQKRRKMKMFHSHEFLPHPRRKLSMRTAAAAASAAAATLVPVL
jgi:hypothetical protein